MHTPTTRVNSRNSQPNLSRAAEESRIWEEDRASHRPPVKRNALPCGAGGSDLCKGTEHDENAHAKEHG